MTLTRRRFLAIAANFAAAPAAALPARWRGTALGAEAEITLHGPRAETADALIEAQRLLRQSEAQFSLYDPLSALTELNSTGGVSPHPDMRRLLDIADRVHHATGGLFDPTVQPLWQALARGDDPSAAQATVGWHRVTLSDRVTLAPGQALTLNGIAQGYATDLIADMLTKRGFTNALVNIGEFRAVGGPFRIGLDDPEAGHLGHRTVTDGAIATSSPGALNLSKGTHILHPARGPVAPTWSTVSVEADTAAFADALSTAFCLMDLPSIHTAKTHYSRATLIDHQGRLRTV